MGLVNLLGSLWGQCLKSQRQPRERRKADMPPGHQGLAAHRMITAASPPHMHIQNRIVPGRDRTKLVEASSYEIRLQDKVWKTGQGR